MPTPFVPLRSFVAGVARHPVSSAPKPAAAASDAGRP